MVYVAIETVIGLSHTQSTGLGIIFNAGKERFIWCAMAGLHKEPHMPILSF